MAPMYETKLKMKMDPKVVRIPGLNQLTQRTALLLALPVACNGTHLGDFLLYGLLLLYPIIYPPALILLSTCLVFKLPIWFIKFHHIGNSYVLDSAYGFYYGLKWASATVSGTEFFF